jgi:hypothetical protein
MQPLILDMVHYSDVTLDQRRSYAPKMSKWIYG